MQINDFDASKLSIEKLEFEPDVTKHELRYDNKPLCIKISTADFKRLVKNRFDDNKIDILLSEPVLKIMTMIDNYMSSKLKNPERYKSITKTRFNQDANRFMVSKYITCRLDGELKSEPIKDVIFKFGDIWKFNVQVGLKLTVGITYKDPIMKKNEKLDDIFIDE